MTVSISAKHFRGRYMLSTLVDQPKVKALESTQLGLYALVKCFRYLGQL